MARDFLFENMGPERLWGQQYLVESGQGVVREKWREVGSQYKLGSVVGRIPLGKPAKGSLQVWKLKVRKVIKVRQKNITRPGGGPFWVFMTRVNLSSADGTEEHVTELPYISHGEWVDSDRVHVIYSRAAAPGAPAASSF
jgi:hypothetical protein